MLNHIILIGRLVKDPELRYTQTGIAVGNFTLAVDRPVNKEKGEKKADFIDVICFYKLAETVANNLEKGRLVAVEGRLQIRSYDDSQGIRRKASEVIAGNIRFLDFRKENGKGAGVEEAFEEVPFNEDDIPF
jgi:single-strand DNA-binding protein